MQKKYAEYLLNKTKEDYNLISENFSNTRNRIWEEIGFLFYNYLEENERVLDLGCGNGRYYDIFKKMGAIYTGIDNSEKLIEIANKKYPEADFQIQDALNLTFDNNYFDKIYSIAVFHHIPSREFQIKFLEQAKRVLKPNGKIILTVWKFRGLKYFFLKDFIKPWMVKDSRYYHAFTKRELGSLFKKTGFKIEQIGVIKNAGGNRQNIYVIAQKCS